jgi:hypothetical protein
MKKADLKTGMRVTDRRGNTAIVLIGTSNGDIISSLAGDENLWCSIDLIPEDLNDQSDKDYSIVKVEGARSNGDYLNKYFTIWKAPETKQMTIEQVQKELGYKIELIK